ncbi:hypothetical protein, partial [Pseudomonas aeruginosa]|uniref:hypothetical protein n=1 Tax=Pseudomonas aeruginosa TaxID=287 RepID=UPI001C833282
IKATYIHLGVGSGCYNTWPRQVTLPEKAVLPAEAHGVGCGTGIDSVHDSVHALSKILLARPAQCRPTSQALRPMQASKVTNNT